jgi:hypothetical protein
MAISGEWSDDPPDSGIMELVGRILLKYEDRKWMELAQKHVQ